MPDHKKEAKRQSKAIEKNTKAYRRGVIMKMRVAGHSLTSIASHLKIPLSTCHKLLKEALNQCAQDQEDAYNELRAQTNARLDVLIRKLWPLVQQGDIPACQTVVKIEERRCKMLGLDKPSKIEVNLEVDMAPEVELLEIAKRLGLTLDQPEIPTVSLEDVKPILVLDYTVSHEDSSQQSQIQSRESRSGDQEVVLAGDPS